MCVCVCVTDNDPSDFPDSMNTTWPADKIATLLREAFTQPQPQPQTPSPSSKGAKSKAKTTTSAAGAGASADGNTPTIDVLITFDTRGVSAHPNHISLYHGARAFVASLAPGGSSSPVDLYTLTTVNVVRKYAGVLDAFATLASGALAAWRGADRSGGGGGGSRSVEVVEKQHPPALVFMHGFGRGGWATAREAMTRAHVSQMVWFRYGWITLSRYMFMNDLRLEKI